MSTPGPRCPSCGDSVGADLRCAGCGRAYALAPAREPADDHTRLLAALASATDDAERVRIRHRLSRLLAQQARDDLLLAMWADVRNDPEADLWRGVAAVIAQPATSVRAVPPLERAAAAFERAGRRDLLALARSYLVHALLSEQRVADAEVAGDLALAVAIEERDGEACMRAAFTRYYSIAYELRLAYRFAESGLRQIAEVIGTWDAGRARRLTQARARLMLMSDTPAAIRLVAEAGVGDEPASRMNDLRFRAQLAILHGDESAAESAFQAILTGRDALPWNSEVPRWVALRRAELALVAGRPTDAIVHVRAATPPSWHRSCFLRVESRWALAEAHARRLPPDAHDRRRRAAGRAARRADRFRDAGIAWREMRWRLLAGELYRGARQRRDAVRELARAVVVARQLGLTASADLIERNLRALGASGRGPERAFGLTPRETEIARLISEGATNADIAARLVVSEATIARHVSNILLRLDLRNRREIGALVRENAELHSS